MLCIRTGYGVDVAEEELSALLADGGGRLFSLLIVTLVLTSPSSHGSSVMIVPLVVVMVVVLLLLVFVTGVTVNEIGREVSEMGSKASVFGTSDELRRPLVSVASSDRPGPAVIGIVPVTVVPLAETATVVVVAGSTMTVLAPSGFGEPPRDDELVSVSSRLVPSLPNGDTAK
uniref:Uncharacterized protein n=1 Tax=Anopheles culicifacies TaxID=139723 RepID=A0A182MV03_9DIPT